MTLTADRPVCAAHSPARELMLALDCPATRSGPLVDQHAPLSTSLLAELHGRPEAVRPVTYALGGART